MTTALVAGAGGMIGGHLVERLLGEGMDVRAIDIKGLEGWWQVHPAAENVAGRFGDLRDLHTCRSAVLGMDWVFNLAADMGGMGFIEHHKADCMLSVLVSTNMLVAARDAQVDRFFYSSSACVYAADKQVSTDVIALREEDAYPAMPEDGYGWEKLFTERMCRHFTEDFGLHTRVARYHNVYGTHTTWEGGREKAPAAICRKVAEAAVTGDRHILIWGDGNQVRSFMAMQDCIEGTLRLMRSDHGQPINVGSDELVSINQLVDLVEEIAGVKLERHYDLTAPQGVRGRNSCNLLITQKLGWEPSTSLRDGLEQLYPWVRAQVEAAIPHQRALTI
jgi:GDP-D-mannose 3', 5'-epimerase